MWYVYTPTSNTIAQVTVTNQNFDARLTLYTGGSCGSLVCEQEIGASKSYRVVTWAAASGTTYYILVSGNTFSDDGTFAITIESFPAPSNEICDTATDISGLLPYTPDNVNNVGSYPYFTSSACDVRAGTRALWYKITTTSNSNIQAYINAGTSWTEGISLLWFL